ncbi:hypothetical protein [Dermacoccus barathri]|uniref:SGNH hydrolase-type esterase domain-containing protein n=1 Tax=Dermacoccus barathri TaxID=322601 RepID=A0ABN2BM67_9MICO
MKPSPAVLCLVSVLGLSACSGDRGSDGSRNGESQASTSSAGASANSSPQPFNGKTSCTDVVYVGDSVSVGMVSKDQIPNRAERLEARFANIGVKNLYVNASGGRSVFERFMNRPNVMDVLTPKLTSTFKGCYVIATGTNDAANDHTGSNMKIRQRIDTVMKATKGRPVLWPLPATIATRGSYNDAYMRDMDAQLRDATKRYPNLRLYDWRAEREEEWVEGDRIHDDRLGSRYRAAMYANALAVAFPQGRPANPSTVVGSAWGKKPSPANRPKLPSVKGDAVAFWAGDKKAVELYESGRKP